MAPIRYFFGTCLTAPSDLRRSPAVLAASLFGSAVIAACQSLRAPLRIQRMLMQQHLDLVEQHAPAPPFHALRQML